MYSLVNVATLVRDLARHPYGRALTDELLVAFALTPDDVAVLDRKRVRRRASVLVAAGRRDGGDALIGDADALVRFVRHDVLAGLWSGHGDLAIATHPAALDVVTDGFRARWVGDTAASPWQEWLASAPAIRATPDLPLVVDAVRTLPADVVASPTSPAWAVHMHDACWAVHLTGRERLAAQAQLHGLRALFAAVPGAPAPRLVATVVAAVHASVVADVLDTDVYATMTGPFFSLLP